MKKMATVLQEEIDRRFEEQRQRYLLSMKNPRRVVARARWRRRWRSAQTFVADLWCWL